MQIWAHDTSGLCEAELVELCGSGWPAKVLDKRTTGSVEGLPSWLESSVEAVERRWPLTASCWTCSVCTASAVELQGWLPGKKCTVLLLLCVSFLYQWENCGWNAKLCVIKKMYKHWLSSHLSKCVEDALGLHSAVYTQTLEAGGHLCETMTESECQSRLQSELQAVQEAWERTSSRLETRRDLVTTTVQVTPTHF